MVSKVKALLQRPSLTTPAYDLSYRNQFTVIRNWMSPVGSRVHERTAAQGSVGIQSPSPGTKYKSLERISTRHQVQ